MQLTGGLKINCEFVKFRVVLFESVKSLLMYAWFILLLRSAFGKNSNFSHSLEISQELSQLKLVKSLHDNWLKSAVEDFGRQYFNKETVLIIGVSSIEGCNSGRIVLSGIDLNGTCKYVYSLNYQLISD